MAAVGQPWVPPLLVPPALWLSWLVIRATGFATDNIAATNINQWYNRRRGQAMAARRSLGEFPPNPPVQDFAPLPRKTLEKDRATW